MPDSDGPKVPIFGIDGALSATDDAYRFALTPEPDFCRVRFPSVVERRCLPVTALIARCIPDQIDVGPFRPVGTFRRIRANSVRMAVKSGTNLPKNIRTHAVPPSIKTIEMYYKLLKNKQKIFSVAPMMDWTDRHCRFFHRQLSRRALLYSEMVTADAAIYGEGERLLRFSDEEHPVALQLGGSEPGKLAEAAKIAAAFGYDEINLNVGCPSDRVQNGAFGACLMREPALVGDCVKAMKDAVSIPVTVKCRIGVDEQDSGPALDNLADAAVAAGVDAIWVHARKAWLAGLSPKQNRDVPPLDYARVYALKRRLPDIFIGINGGIASLRATREHLEKVDGAMLGRAAYRDATLLTGVDEAIYGEETKAFDWWKLCDTMIAYCEREKERGTRLSTITRHMIGLFHGWPGARRYRQILSEEARLETARPETIARAFEAVLPRGDFEDDGGQAASREVA